MLYYLKDDISSFSQAIPIDNSILLPRYTTLADNHNRAIPIMKLKQIKMRKLSATLSMK